MILLTAGMGLWLGAQGVWIHAKARLAQHLLEDAWSQTLHSGTPVPPWPWADTWPVARLSAPGMDIDLIVLAGDGGRTLAFGPGHATGSAAPGRPGTTLIGGHRDTHFRFLRHLRPGDRIGLQSSLATETFQVTTTRVVDSKRYRVVDPGEGRRLVLVTCFPFDALAPGGPLRYVVEAEPVRL